MEVFSSDGCEEIDIPPLIQTVRHVGYTIGEPSESVDALPSLLAGRRQNSKTRRTE
jgi:hypothetical protein